MIGWLLIGWPTLSESRKEKQRLSEKVAHTIWPPPLRGRPAAQPPGGGVSS